ncbi:MAG TPA: type II secretion system protein [Deltaproteobacteria bacterium]|nr:type II secretion system protein [Deltaproteobacteria bacterium]
MRSKKGFTLVELLVVISIIALLLSILMPSLRKAKLQAQFIVCKSNLRQYGLAGAMYLDDNDNAFPHPTYCIFSRESYWTPYNQHYHFWACRWHDAGITPDGPFWPYIAEKDVHVCPTFRAIAKIRGKNHPWHDAAPVPIPIEPQFSYSMNGFLSAGDEGEDLILRNGADVQMPKLTDVKRPSAILFFTEENIWTITYPVRLSDYPLNDTYFGPAKYGYGGDCIATFHKAHDPQLNTGVSNVLFVDGHVAEESAWKRCPNFCHNSWYLCTQN